MNPGMQQMNPGMQQMNQGNGMNNNIMMTMMGQMMDQMMNIMSNMVKENNNKETPSFNEDIINLQFQSSKKKEEENFTINIVCHPKEKWKDVFQRYCFKTNEKKEYLLFICNAKRLQDDQTVGSTDLFNSPKILVIDIRDLEGSKYIYYNF